MNSPVHRPRLVGALSVMALISVACQTGGDSGTGPSTAAEAGASAATMPSGSQGSGGDAPNPSAGASTDAVSQPSSGASGSAQGEEVSVFDLEEGDCFSAGGEQVENVIVVDCEEPHIFEVYAVLEHEAADDEEYPGGEEIQAYADEECEGRFEDFIGTDYESSQWFITSISPTQETWAGGDREVLCTVNLEDRSEVTSSAEGSKE